MIRSLQAIDHIALLDVQRKAYQIEAQLLDVAVFPPLSETLPDLKEERPDGFVYIWDEQIVGVITYDTTTITRLVVDPAYFRRGIAQALVHHLLKHRDVTQVMTGARNQPALALYAAFGFKEVRREWRTDIELVYLTRN